MRVVVKDPRCAPREVHIDGQLRDYQKLVDGYIQHIALAPGLGLLCNEEGKLRWMEPNIRYNNVVIVGPVVIVGQDGAEFTEVADEDLNKVMWFLREFAV